MDISPLIWLIVAWFVLVGIIEAFFRDRVKVYYLIALMARSSGVERILKPLANAIEKIPRIAISVIVIAFFALSMAYAVPVMVPLPAQLIGYVVGLVPSFIRILVTNLIATVSVLSKFHTVSSSEAASQLVSSRFTPATPLIPGVTIGLSAFLIILVAIGLSILVHEVSHGVVALRYGGRIKSGGVFLSLFILYGGFVEVDEDDLRSKSGLGGILAMLSAGVFSNIVLSVVAVALLYLALIPPLQPYLSGVLITGIVDKSPAFYAGIPSNSVLLAVDNKPVTSITSLIYILSGIKPGSLVTLKIFHNGAVSIYNVLTTANPNNKNMPFIGIYVSDRLFYQFIYWLWTINIVLVLLNTMPAWPLDGGQFLYYLILYALRGNRRVATTIMYVLSITLWSLFIFTLIISLSSGLWRIAVMPP